MTEAAEVGNKRGTEAPGLSDAVLAEAVAEVEDIGAKCAAGLPLHKSAQRLATDPKAANSLSSCRLCRREGRECTGARSWTGWPRGLPGRQGRASGDRETASCQRTCKKRSDVIASAYIGGYGACSPNQRFLPNLITSESAACLHCLVELGKRNLSLKSASWMIGLYDLSLQ